MDCFHCKPFTVPERQKNQKICVHVAVDRLSGGLTRAQGAKRSDEATSGGTTQHAQKFLL